MDGQVMGIEGDLLEAVDLEAGMSRRKALGLGAAAAGLVVAGSILPAVPALAATGKPKIVAPVALGVIQADRMGLAMVYYDQITMTALNKGVGHWPGTPLAGQLGNGVYAGHRVSKHRAFLNIDLMQVNDPIDIHVFQFRATYRYRVTGAEIVDPKRDAARVLAQTPAQTVTLFACHPKKSIKFRYVVRAAFQGQL